MEPRWLSLILLVAILTRLPVLKACRMTALLAASASALVALTLWNNTLFPLKLYPALINLGMLCLFGFSLIHPPTVIERFARIKEPDLSDAGIRYIRGVTQVWCLFFIVNGSLALFTAFFTSEAVWSLYNGCIAYILMGLLFVTEYIFRLRFKRKNA